MFTYRVDLLTLYSKQLQAQKFLLSRNDKKRCISQYLGLEIQPPHGGLLSSFCEGLQPSAATQGTLGPKDDFDEQTDKRTTDLRELDI